MTSPVRAALGRMKYKPKERGPIEDHMGSVVQRASHWRAVEVAQDELNDSAKRGNFPSLVLECSLLMGAVEDFSYRKVRWAVVQEAQLKLNKAARKLPGLSAEVETLERALEEYYRIAPAKGPGMARRQPGVGGLS